MFSALANEPLLWTTGWVLLNSMWIVTVVWIVHRLVQGLIDQSSAITRYRSACTMLVLLTASHLLLGWVVWMKKPVTDWVIPPQKLLDSQGHYSSLDHERSAFFAKVISWLAPASVVAASTWLLMAVVSSLWLVWAWRRIHLMMRSGRPLRHDELPELAELEQLLLEKRNSVRVCVNDAVISPATAGWWQPVIMLPETSLRKLTSDEMRCVLAHELAHIKRSDYLVNLVQTVCELALVYHPLARSLSSDIRQIREECCDELAAGVSGGVKQYGKALLAMEDLIEHTRLTLPATGGSLYDRIERLIRFKMAPGRESPVQLATALIMACTLLVGSTVVLARATEFARIDADLGRMQLGEIIVREMGCYTDQANADLAPAMKDLVRTHKNPRSIPAEELAPIVRVLSRGAHGDELVREQLPFISLTTKSNDFSPVPLEVGKAAYWGRVAERIWDCAGSRGVIQEQQEWSRVAIVLACQKSFGFTHLPLIFKDPALGKRMEWSATTVNRYCRVLLYGSDRQSATLDLESRDYYPHCRKGMPFSRVAYDSFAAMLYCQDLNSIEQIQQAQQEMKVYLSDPVVCKLSELLKAKEQICAGK